MTTTLDLLRILVALLRGTVVLLDIAEGR